jgi:hypothetical protein
MQLTRTDRILATALVSLATVSVSLAVIAPAAAVQGQSQPFSLSIAGPEKAIAAGGTCDVSVTLTNVSGKPIPVRVTNGEEGAYKDFGVNVVSEPSGTVIKPIPLDARREMYSQYSSFRFKTLQPEESMFHTIHVCKLFDLSAPGTYKIQLRRDVPKEIGTGVVTSNTIKITTVP